MLKKSIILFLVLNVFACGQTSSTAQPHASAVVISKPKNSVVQTTINVNNKEKIFAEMKQAVVQRDYDKVLKLLMPLAQQGDATAQNNIAVMYQDGLGVARSDSEALKWYLKAAQQGEAEAQFMVGLFYAQGRGVAQNYEQATHWYELAAKQGHMDAQNNLAIRYASGMGVKKDIEKAKYWFSQAAAQGHLSAAAELEQIQQLQKNGKLK